MAQTRKPLYGSNNQSVTITLSSQANGAYRGSSGVDNTTTLYSGMKFRLKYKTAGTLGTNPQVSIYLADSADGGTTYSDNLAAGDANVTPSSPPNLKGPAVMNCPVTATQYFSDTFYFDKDFGLMLVPDKFFFVVLNNTGATSDTTAGNFSLIYEGFNDQFV